MRALACALALALTACGSGAPEAAPSEAAAGMEQCCVIDEANMLSPEEEARINALSADIQRATKAQIAVKTVPDLRGKGIDRYALDEANRLGVGDAKRNDGVLIVIAPKELLVRIAVGSGLEDVLSDTQAMRIIQEAMVPLFSRGDAAGAVEAGMKRIDETLRNPGRTPDDKANRADEAGKTDWVPDIPKATAS